MSDEEQFFSRWSRRKRAAAQTPQTPNADAAPAATPASPGTVERPAEPARSATLAAPDSAFDPATLPPIESITAATDIRPFLVPGVPPELTRAALRRVWTADPSIRDFVGLAEYAWDFNTPGSMPGFGTVEMTEQMRSEISRMVGRSLAGDDEAAAESPKVATTAELPDQSPPQHRVGAESPPAAAIRTQSEDRASEPMPRRNEDYVAVQSKPSASNRLPATKKRLHGGALPKNYPS